MTCPLCGGKSIGCSTGIENPAHCQNHANCKSDGDSIAHLEACDESGCYVCGCLLEFYEACDGEACGRWGHKSTMLCRDVGGVMKSFCGGCVDGRRGS